MTNTKRKPVKPATDATDRQTCGIIRPISGTTEYSASHWREVHEIVEDAAHTADFDLRLVSDSDSANVILSGIIRNIYNDPIIVCDVSSKNPNVMFELGLRMAFQRPVVIIADDITDFSFDISPVRHIKYPRSLRYSGMITLRDELVLTITSTLEESQKSDYRGYLQQFGPIHVAGLETQTVAFDTIAQELVELKRAVQGLNRSRTRQPRSLTPGDFRYIFNMRITPEEARYLEKHIDELDSYLSHFTMQHDGVFNVKIREYTTRRPADKAKLDEMLREHGIILSDLEPPA